MQRAIKRVNFNPRAAIKKGVGVLFYDFVDLRAVAHYVTDPDVRHSMGRMCAWRHEAAITQVIFFFYSIFSTDLAEKKRATRTREPHLDPQRAVATSNLDPRRLELKRADVRSAAAWGTSKHRVANDCCRSKTCMYRSDGCVVPLCVLFTISSDELFKQYSTVFQCASVELRILVTASVWTVCHKPA